LDNFDDLDDLDDLEGHGPLRAAGHSTL